MLLLLLLLLLRRRRLAVLLLLPCRRPGYWRWQLFQHVLQRCEGLHRLDGRPRRRCRRWQGQLPRGRRGQGGRRWCCGSRWCWCWCWRWRWRLRGRLFHVLADRLLPRRSRLACARLAPALLVRPPAAPGRRSCSCCCCFCCRLDQWRPRRHQGQSHDLERQVPRIGQGEGWRRLDPNGWRRRHGRVVVRPAVAAVLVPHLARRQQLAPLRHHRHVVLVAGR